MTTTNVNLTAKVTEPITLTAGAVTKVAELIAARAPMSP